MKVGSNPPGRSASPDPPSGVVLEHGPRRGLITYIHTFLAWSSFVDTFLLETLSCCCTRQNIVNTAELQVRRPGTRFRVERFQDDSNVHISHLMPLGNIL